MLRERVEELDTRLKKNWGACQLCPIGFYATKHVLVEHVGFDDPYLQKIERCPLLFVGEAPGESEDVIGRPFVGKSGKLLRDSIDLLQETLSLKVPYSITNVVACRPCNGPNTANRQPDKKEMANCAPRLIDIVRTLDPVCVVALGHVAKLALEKANCHYGLHGVEFDEFYLNHPAYVLRSGGFGSETHKVFMQELSEALKLAEEYLENVHSS